ncbi:uncharacterized protein LOC131618079 [Vicia villosa]|uniref:uncharacterized protein LOC131618079 n=1 Tax=Vicia villosa TaxID=3911 RepID=UPI00273B6F47|nr:uncharacterized protein LOC131618079 [Vicia villosa]
MSTNIHEENPQKSCGRKLFERVAKWFEYKDKEKWIKGMKTSMGIAVSIIATVTFSLATNPPGGVVQVSVNDDPLCSDKTGYNICAGEAILATLYKNYYLRFLICNTICFISALSVLLFLVSGIPIEKTFPVWLLSIGMSITLTSFALTYLFAVNMVTPNVIWNHLLENVFGIAIFVWAIFVAALGVFLVVRLIVRVVNKLWNNDK